MNAHRHHVLKFVPTQRVVTSAHVTLDTHCTAMEDLALVCYIKHYYVFLFTIAPVIILAFIGVI